MSVARLFTCAAALRTFADLCRVTQDLIDDVPLYVNVKEVCREDGTVEALELNYLTFYAHNGSCVLAVRPPVIASLCCEHVSAGLIH